VKVKHAESVVRTVYGGNLGVGALWISGLLDDAPEAVKTLKRHAARKAREARAKTLAAPNAKGKKAPSKRSR
jgi:hypothetical protein